MGFGYRRALKKCSINLRRSRVWVLEQQIRIDCVAPILRFGFSGGIAGKAAEGVGETSTF
jgi:hypothetical protein